MKTRKEITTEVLEQLRTNKIASIVEVGIIADAKKQMLKEGGLSSSQRTKVKVDIQNAEASIVAMEGDLKLLEKKLKEAKKDVKG